jgi:hypothetical protein
MLLLLLVVVGTVIMKQCFFLSEVLSPFTRYLEVHVRSFISCSILRSDFLIWIHAAYMASIRKGGRWLAVVDIFPFDRRVLRAKSRLFELFDQPFDC